MIGGFALVAYPAKYCFFIMTFILDYDGAVYQKDSGWKSEEKVQAITLFNAEFSLSPGPTSPLISVTISMVLTSSMRLTKSSDELASIGSF